MVHRPASCARARCPSEQATGTKIAGGIVPGLKRLGPCNLAGPNSDLYTNPTGLKTGLPPVDARLAGFKRKNGWRRSCFLVRNSVYPLFVLRCGALPLPGRSPRLFQESRSMPRFHSSHSCALPRWFPSSWWFVRPCVCPSAGSLHKPEQRAALDVIPRDPDVLPRRPIAAIRSRASSWPCPPSQHEAPSLQAGRRVTSHGQAKI